MRSSKAIIREARNRAGLTQRQLATKALTAQSVVARIELGETSPSWDTLMRLARAAGFTLQTSLQRIPVVDKSVMDDVPRILKMTPEERLEEVAQVSRFIAGAKRV